MSRLMSIFKQMEMEMFYPDLAYSIRILSQKVSQFCSLCFISAKFDNEILFQSSISTPSLSNKNISLVFLCSTSHFYKVITVLHFLPPQTEQNERYHKPKLFLFYPRTSPSQYKKCPTFSDLFKNLLFFP